MLHNLAKKNSNKMFNQNLELGSTLLLRNANLSTDAEVLEQWHCQQSQYREKFNSGRTPFRKMWMLTKICWRKPELCKELECLA